MSAGVQLTGMIQPSPDMVYDETYEADETILPKQDGRWTLFAVQPIFTKADEALPIAREYNPGHPASSPVQVTWLAADQVAYSYTFGKFREQQTQMARAQAAEQMKPKILVPQG